MSSNYSFKIEPCDRQGAQTIVKEINRFNFSKVPALSPDWTALEFIAKNEDGQEIGGILGGIDCYLGLEINILWVHHNYRKKGLGSQLLKHMENIAINNGATVSVLNTFDFQAEDFYLKNGYQVFGRIIDHPRGHSRIYFKKNLI